MSTLADLVATGPLVYSAIPAVKAQDVIYVKGIGMMEWVVVTGTGQFTGYRTLRCGTLEFGTSSAPRSYEADLVGGLGSKVTQASIWAWAQQQGHVIAASSWTTRVFKFADVDAGTFRFPDLRDVFAGFTGTDPDTGLAIPIGAYKADTLKGHVHETVDTSNFSLTNTSPFDKSAITRTGGAYTSTFTGPTTFTAPSGNAETAPKRTAFAPRIHI